METYIMFLDWKNQYCQKEYTIQGNQEMNANPIKVPLAFFIELEQKKIFKFVWRHKRPQIAKESWERKMRVEESDFLLQTILQSYGNQNSMVLAQKQTSKSMEQDRKPRNKPTHLQSINIWQRKQDYTMLERQSLQKMVLEKLDSYI